jgi:hypothetical protein
MLSCRAGKPILAMTAAETAFEANSLFKMGPDLHHYEIG